MQSAANKALQSWTITEDTIVNKSINLYGATGSGKSRVINSILNEIGEVFDQIIVFYPNEEVSPTYTGMVEKPYIHSRLTANKIREIWNRQQTLSHMYIVANTLEYLYNIVRCIADDNKINEFDDMMNKHSRIKARSSDDVLSNKLLPRWTKYVKMTFKLYITKHIDRAERALPHFGENERIVVQYLHLNPRILIIFDDCVTEMSELKSDPIINKLYTMARHANITFFNAVQDDTQLPPDFRKGAFYSIFTDRSCAEGFCTRKTNNIGGKDIRTAALRHIEYVFDGSRSPVDGEYKLIYDRISAKFYKYDITGKGLSYKKTMGSNITIEFGKRISAESGGQTTVHNKYIK